jgi:hypothetical protein
MMNRLTSHLTCHTLQLITDLTVGCAVVAEGAASDSPSQSDENQRVASWVSGFAVYTGTRSVAEALTHMQSGLIPNSILYVTSAAPQWDIELYHSQYSRPTRNPSCLLGTCTPAAQCSGSWWRCFALCTRGGTCRDWVEG